MIVAGFVILVGLLLWTVIFAKGPWLAKLILILLVPAFAVAVHRALDGYRGYPTKATIPTRAQLLASLVREPEPGDAGAIYLWLLEDDRPRAYVIPYSRRMHVLLARAAAELQHGQTVRLQRISKNMFRRYRLPPAQPPRKEPQ